MTKLEFNTLVVQQTAYLYVYALQFTKDQDDAQDLVQDTVMKAVMYYGRFREGTNLKGWLYTIMKNTFINNYRRISKSTIFLSQSDEIPYKCLLRHAACNQGENKFIMEDIRRALSVLAEEYHTPFCMYYEGFKYHEIAEKLQIPIGTVKTRIHLARKIMKSKLRAYKPN